MTPVLPLVLLGSYFSTRDAAPDDGQDNPELEFVCHEMCFQRPRGKERAEQFLQLGA